MRELDELRAIIALDGLKADGPYTLASGRTTDWYVDLRDLLLVHYNRRIAGECLWSLIDSLQCSLIAGPMSGACPLLFAIQEAGQSISRFSRIARVRKEDRGHGVGGRILGRVSKGERVIVVEDVITTGGSARSAASAIEDAGGQVVAFVSIINRDFLTELVVASSDQEATNRIVPVHSLLYGKDLLKKPEIA